MITIKLQVLYIEYFTWLLYFSIFECVCIPDLFCRNVPVLWLVLELILKSQVTLGLAIFRTFLISGKQAKTGHDYFYREIFPRPRYVCCRSGVLKLCTSTFIMYFGNQIWKFMYAYFGKFSGKLDFLYFGFSFILKSYFS